MKLIAVFCIVAFCQMQGYESGKIQSRLVGKDVITDTTTPLNNVAFFVLDTPNTAICSGAVIHFKWILTAASCVKNYGSGTLRFKRGSTIGAGTPNHYETAALINTITAHPRYADSTRLNDIALVNPIIDMIDATPILNRPYAITKTNQVLPNLAVTLRGYGPRTGNDEEPTSGTLTEANTVLSKIADCRKYDTTIPTTKLCSIKGRVCIGDQGGPLVLRSSEEIIGIISVPVDVENSCSFPIKPIVTYTNVFLFRAWITQVTNTDI